MAKEVKTATTPAAAPQFTIDKGIELPAIQRLSGGGKESPYATFMKTMKVGKTPASTESFFIPATVADSIKGDERQKAIAEEVRKISNKVSGIGRRLAKSDASKSYTLRSRDENGVFGVRVYCVAGKVGDALPPAPQA